MIFNAMFYSYLKCPESLLQRSQYMVFKSGFKIELEKHLCEHKKRLREV